MKFEIEGRPFGDPTVRELPSGQRKKRQKAAVILDLNKMSREEIHTFVKRENEKRIKTREYALLQSDDDEADEEECEVVVLSDDSDSDRAEKQESNVTLEESDSVGCIDSSHPKPCRICASAPEEQDFDEYKLIEPKTRNRPTWHTLKSLIFETSQWQSYEARVNLACRYRERKDLAAFRRTLLSKSCRRWWELTKPDLLRICLAWGFKSNLWQRKDDTKKSSATKVKSGQVLNHLSKSFQAALRAVKR